MSLLRFLLFVFFFLQTICKPKECKNGFLALRPCKTKPTPALESDLGPCTGVPSVCRQSPLPSCPVIRKLGNMIVALLGGRNVVNLVPDP